MKMEKIIKKLEEKREALLQCPHRHYGLWDICDCYIAAQKIEKILAAGKMVANSNPHLRLETGREKK